MLFSTIESATDSDGYTTGDLVKTSLGILLIAGSFNPITGPLVAAYSLADVIVGISTVYSITDRLGTAIDSSLSH